MSGPARRGFQKLILAWTARADREESVREIPNAIDQAPVEASLDDGGRSPASVVYMFDATTVLGSSLHTAAASRRSEPRTTMLLRIPSVTDTAGADTGAAGAPEGHE